MKIVSGIPPEADDTRKILGTPIPKSSEFFYYLSDPEYYIDSRTAPLYALKHIYLFFALETNLKNITVNSSFITL